MKSILLSLAGKVIVATFILTLLAITTRAQDKKQAPKEKPKKEKTMPKEHECTQACHDSGKHVYAHGEKGHVCTSICKK